MNIFFSELETLTSGREYGCQLGLKCIFVELTKAIAIRKDIF